jgi:hypothetical protein
MSNLFFDQKDKNYADDESLYFINQQLLEYTEKVLKDYGNLTPSNEGIAYWAGIRNENKTLVKMVVAPDAESEERRVITSTKSNADYVRLLAKTGYVHIGQVHSHPGKFIDHSIGDDEWTPFKRNGLISIVVESYCKFGMFPLRTCGVHKYIENKFIRLNEAYIDERFIMLNDPNIQFNDLRK